MAIVPNAALSGGWNPGSTTNTDKPYNSPNRSNAGEPNGSITPQYVGEIVLDTTNNILWKATTVLNTGWVQLTAG